METVSGDQLKKARGQAGIAKVERGNLPKKGGGMMKLTYSTMIGGVVEEYIFEGPIGEVFAAWSALFDFEGPDEPESCSLTGRSCDACKHQGACYGCGAHYAHWEPEMRQNEGQGKL